MARLLVKSPQIIETLGIRAPSVVASRSPSTANPGACGNDRTSFRTAPKPLTENTETRIARLHRPVVATAISNTEARTETRGSATKQSGSTACRHTGLRGLLPSRGDLFRGVASPRGGKPFSAQISRRCFATRTRHREGCCRSLDGRRGGGCPARTATGIPGRLEELGLRFPGTTAADNWPGGRVDA